MTGVRIPVGVLARTAGFDRRFFCRLTSRPVGFVIVRSTRKQGSVAVPKEQIFIGSVFAVVCVIVVWQAPWMCEHSRFGQSLARRLGERAGVWTIRAIFGGLAVLGVLLASGVVSPLRW